jgi:CBS domain-containing protein
VAKQVRDAMTANPRTVLLDASAFEAAKAMEEEDVGSIPVVDSDGILAGMVTDRDITLRVVAARRDPDSTPVSEIASKDISPAYPDESLDEALQQMAQRQVRRLPVIEDDRVVGILAQADVAQEAKDKKTGHLIEEISRSDEQSGG